MLFENCRSENLATSLISAACRIRCEPFFGGEEGVSRGKSRYLKSTIALFHPWPLRSRRNSGRGINVVKKKEQAIFDIQIIGAVLVGKEYAISWNFMRPIVDLCHPFFAIFDQFTLSDHHRHPLSKYSLHDTPVFTLNLNRNFSQFGRASPWLM